MYRAFSSFVIVVFDGRIENADVHLSEFYERETRPKLRFTCGRKLKKMGMD